jgi:hypothetical protein
MNWAIRLLKSFLETSSFIILYFAIKRTVQDIISWIKNGSLLRRKHEPII